MQRQQIGTKIRRVILALRTAGYTPYRDRKHSTMFARKHKVRWLTTHYRQPDPLPNPGACIYPHRHQRLIAHPAPLVELYTLTVTGKRAVQTAPRTEGYRHRYGSRHKRQFAEVAQQFCESEKRRAVALCIPHSSTSLHFRSPFVRFRRLAVRSRSLLPRRSAPNPCRALNALRVSLRLHHVPLRYRHTLPRMRSHFP